MSAPEALKKADGAGGIAVSREMRQMKDETRVADPLEKVRTAGGRTYLWRDGGWVDSELAQSAPKQQLKVKYLSQAYFALLKGRPELKAGLALGDRVAIVVGKGKAVYIAPNEGEVAAEKVTAFLK